VIAQRFVEQGQNIRAKERVVKFQDVEEVVIAVDIPEIVMVADLRAADIVEMVAEFNAAPGIRFPVHIQEIAQRSDPVTQTFLARAAMKSPIGINVLPGMTATINLTYRRANVLSDRILVPITAVSKDSTGAQVAWTVDREGNVARHVVKTGEVTGGSIEILDGLQPGDRITVAGASFLREGMRVRDLGNALDRSQP
jgi:multidrug efflux system membrane fusion protein